jgi:hypothetical protein
MYSLRANEKTQLLVKEVADMVGLSVSSIMRKVKRKMDTGRLAIVHEDVVAVTHRNGNVIKFQIPSTYHKFLDGWLTADMEPLNIRETHKFRNCLVAACLDTKDISKAQRDKKKVLDYQLKNYESMKIAELRALYAEVM